MIHNTPTLIEKGKDARLWSTFIFSDSTNAEIWQKPAYDRQLVNQIYVIGLCLEKGEKRRTIYLNL